MEMKGFQFRLAIDGVTSRYNVVTVEVRAREENRNILFHSSILIMLMTTMMMRMGVVVYYAPYERGR
jgi:hypothetical protein